MKNLQHGKYLFLLLGFINISILAHGQVFKSIDVNTRKDSYPGNFHFSSTNRFAELNGIFYFEADDGLNGAELYRSDGTESGTKLVKDINPGTAPSNPYDITISAGKIYFVAEDNEHGREVWVSDGTEQGTKMVADIAPQGDNIYAYGPAYLTDVNGILYFAFYYNDYNTFPNTFNQLWKTDGTKAGTAMVADFYIPEFDYSSSPQQLTNVNGILFFTLYGSTSGKELYTSDGTAAGTHIVADLNQNLYTGSLPSHLTPVNGLLYFAADDGAGGRLWVSDGTANGTHKVKNANNIFLPVSFDDRTDSFTLKSNVTLYFQGSTDVAGNELCKYNTSDTLHNNIVMVKDIVPGNNSSYPSFVTNVNGTLFFTIGPAGADAQLWKSDGTKAGTVQVKDITPGGQNFYSNLINVNGTLFFSYANEALGNELWKSNGTGAGTVIVKDILPGATNSYPDYLTYQNGIFLFRANGTKGYELWRTDGTTAGTVMVKNINSTATASSNPLGFAITPGHKIIFSAYDGHYPFNLYTTNGTKAGTKLVDTTATIQPLFNQPVFTNFKDNSYFIDNSNKLWKTNGTNEGTSVVSGLGLEDYSGYVINLVAAEDLFYIFTYSYLTGQLILWRSDGTSKGTYIVKSDIPNFYAVSSAAVGKNLFFSNFNFNTNTSEIWKSDGSVPGTVVVKSTSTANPAFNLFNFKGKLYFIAYTPTNNYGPSLWKSDGTEAGTGVLKDVAVVRQPFATANGKLFFYALDLISEGYELYSTDGTAGGTKVVKDINNGPANSNSYNSLLVTGDTVLYFLADDGKHGVELWKSNGTTNGTLLVRDITPDINGSSLTNLINVKDKLFFTINDTLWHSNGTRKGTNPVADENLKGVRALQSLSAVGDTLYFSAYTYNTGQEVYFGTVENKAPMVKITSPANNANYPAPATITLTADASDVDGAIKTVDFYNGNKLLFTEVWPPFSRNWNNVPAGNYSITAKATDNEGKETVSESVTVSVGTQLSFADNQKELNGLAEKFRPFILNINPNPVNNTVNIFVQGLSTKSKSIVSVLSVSGVVMKTVQSSNLNKNLQLDVSALSAGVYYIEVSNADKVMYKRFIKL